MVIDSMANKPTRLGFHAANEGLESQAEPRFDEETTGIELTWEENIIVYQRRGWVELSYIHK